MGEPIIVCLSCRDGEGCLGLEDGDGGNESTSLNITTLMLSSGCEEKLVFKVFLRDMRSIIWKPFIRTLSSENNLVVLLYFVFFSNVGFGISSVQMNKGPMLTFLKKQKNTFL